MIGRDGTPAKARATPVPDNRRLAAKTRRMPFSAFLICLSVSRRTLAIRLAAYRHRKAVRGATHASGRQMKERQ
jgi:hypothetical protein